ncbi:hypothetical protein E2C01_064735 [Portunus trituberculatus]|uniref:Uncharacterized protein n=1 Tax=Portunus trituberculatus TaxID=210409 RepID=A0A5B7HLM7_PORTR|nr:hypothetical protein [Portunus trituberculatus]
MQRCVTPFLPLPASVIAGGACRALPHAVWGSGLHHCMNLDKFNYLIVCRTGRFHLCIGMVGSRVARVGWMVALMAGLHAALASR